MIKIVGIEFIPRLGNGRPENGTGTFVETVIIRRYCRLLCANSVKLKRAMLK